MTIYERFAAAAARHPSSIALEMGRERVSYEALHRRAEALAAALAAMTSPGARVAINAHKGIDPIVAMLACLRAGRPYVPIDPASPVPRRLAILQSCTPEVLILDGKAAREWSEAGGPPPAIAQVVAPPGSLGPGRGARALDELIEAGQGAAPVARVPDADDIAYLLYTSGSTGEPKGVLITHANAAAFVEWGLAAFDVGAGDRVAVHAPLHFDLPVFDLYVSLACGATVCPIDERTVLFPEGLRRFLQERQISVIYAVPSAYKALLHRTALAPTDLPQLRLVLYAGEEFQADALARLMDKIPQARFFNLYGPIEANVIAAYEVVRGQKYDRVPIGHPTAGATLILVDEEGRPIEEDGREGELLVAGPSVSPGYLGDPERTARSRMTVRLADRELVCYRTGDFVQRDADGALVFVGRRDALIKTRGFRVDLGDVESNLIRHPLVEDVAVVARPSVEHTNTLHAFVVPRAGADVDEARLVDWCRERLPPYMVPSAITLRSELPRTSTGKVSRRALLEQPEQERT